jgi:hypothetical protein
MNEELEVLSKSQNQNFLNVNINLKSINKETSIEDMIILLENQKKEIDVIFYLIIFIFLFFIFRI